MTVLLRVYLYFTVLRGDANSQNLVTEPCVPLPDYFYLCVRSYFLCTSCAKLKISRK